MKPMFQVTVTDITPFDQIADVWSVGQHQALLDEMGVGDLAGLPDDEITEMCLMALQDREPAEAAALLLKYRMGDDLSDGQIQHLCNEMLDEKLWEEYAEIGLHESFYEVAMLLHAAVAGSVPEPDAITVTLNVVATNADGKTLLENPLDESWLIRLLADGMPEDCLLLRLFGEQIRGDAFPEASDIIWSFTSANASRGQVFTLRSSRYLFGDVEPDSEYQSTATPDVIKTD